MFKRLKEDIGIIKERDPAARSSLEVLLLYPGLHAIVLHRAAHWLFRHRLLFLARVVSQTSRFVTGIEIHPGAKIGRGVFFDHGSGIVIGETSEVGDYCIIYQGVTLGGTGKDKGKRHPTLGRNVMVGSGAKVLGPFKVGDNAKIAANAVVLSEVPPDTTAVGVPARFVNRAGTDFGVKSQLDQVHMPDPISQQICQMQIHINRLENTIARLLEEHNKGDNTNENI